MADIKNHSDKIAMSPEGCSPSGDYYLTSADQYVKYSSQDIACKNKSNLSAEDHWSNALPAHYGTQGLSAAFRTPENKLCLFSGSTFVTSDNFSSEKDIFPSWGKVRNNIHNPPQNQQRIDTGFNYGDRTYLFSGDQCFCYRYDTDRKEYYEYVDEGYPRKIANMKEVFQDLSGHFHNGIDAAFRFENRVYFLRGAYYVRYEKEGDKFVNKIQDASKMQTAISESVKELKKWMF